MRWLYGARGFKGQNGQSGLNESRDFATWLDHGPGLFWITGRPGSGKSTAMKFIYENAGGWNSRGDSPRTQTSNTLARQSFKDSSDLMRRASKHQPDSACCCIGLFITDRGAQEQRRWEPMLHGTLLQLLKAQPALSRDLLALMAERQVDSRSSAGDKAMTPDMMEQEIPEWSVSLVKHALMHCKKQSKRPFKALIILDGLDELEMAEDAKAAVDFMRQLSDDSEKTNNIFRICLSSRSEEMFRLLFQETWRIEIHRHTKNDIRYFTWSRLSMNPRFTGQKLEDVFDQLEPLLDYVASNAQGVFLWARSVVTVIYDALSRWEPLENIPELVKQLPTEIKELYRYILRRIEPRLRRKAFIMLEAVLRSRRPVTLLELLLVVKATEGHVTGNPNVWSSTSEMQYPDIEYFNESLNLQGQLISTCKCLLEIAQPHDHDHEYWSYRGRYARQAREFWVSRHEQTRATENVGNAELTSWESSITTMSSGSDEESDFETGNSDFVELVSREQYQDYHGQPSVDPSRAVIRLLHRSAKEVLMDANFLDTLFPPNSMAEKPPGNGHAYFLIFVRQWLRLPHNVRKQLRCHILPAVETIYHASLLETTMSDATPYFDVIDDIDTQAQITMPDRECWPLEWYREANRWNDRGIRHWHVTFPAIAVAMNLRGYMEHRMLKAEAEGPEELHRFLNGKHGRPLLHFSVFMPLASPKPEMTKFLVEKRVDLNLKFEGKTAIESLVLNYGSFSNDWQLQVMEQLIEAGADPNSRHYPRAGADLSTWIPLLHIVAYNRYTMDIRHRIRFMRLLCNRGANVNGTDSLGRTFLEKLYWGWQKLPQDEWVWLLQKGAKISSSIVSRTLHQGSDGQKPVEYTVTGHEHGEEEIGLQTESWKRILVEDHSHESFESMRSMSEGFTGLCDGRGRQDAFLILQQPRFRRREWYDDEAADLAVSLIPSWFADTPSHPRRNDRTPS